MLGDELARAVAKAKEELKKLHEDGVSLVNEDLSVERKTDGLHLFVEFEVYFGEPGASRARAEIPIEPMLTYLFNQALVDAIIP